MSHAGCKVRSEGHQQGVAEAECEQEGRPKTELECAHVVYKVLVVGSKRSNECVERLRRSQCPHPQRDPQTAKHNRNYEGGLALRSLRGYER